MNRENNTPIKNYINFKQTSLMESNLFQKIYKYISKIPDGKILTGELVDTSKYLKYVNSQNRINVTKIANNRNNNIQSVNGTIKSAVNKFGGPWLFNSLTQKQKNAEFLKIDPMFNSKVDKIKHATWMLNDLKPGSSKIMPLATVPKNSPPPPDYWYNDQRF